MSDIHPSSLSEWALRIMALAGLCVLIVLSSKIILNVTRKPSPAVRSAQR